MVNFQGFEETLSGKAEKLNTGSDSFNKILGGGLAASAVTDVYGAAAAGKTQFAFQNALVTCLEAPDAHNSKPKVVFVDCAGSFRPERIVEMAEARGVQKPSSILDRISSIYVRSVAEQQEASQRILTSNLFDNTRLLVVDDVTTNFVAEYPGDSEDQEENFISRYLELATYTRKLVYIGLRRRLAVLLTNSVRSRIREDNNSSSSSVEVETTGDIICQFVLFRLHFMRRGTLRQGIVVQPFVENATTAFSIEKMGIVP